MTKRVSKTVLFLCTGNYFRSRFAEIYFNAVAAKMGLSWRATSRALALERGVNNVGPISSFTLDTLKRLGMRDADAMSRMPMQATLDDFEKADYVVALKQAEHHPLLHERFPSHLDKVEFWHVDDAAEVLGLIEREVTDLAARLITGTKRKEATPFAAAEKPALKREVSVKAVKPIVSVRRETKGRRGKGVTTVSDVPQSDLNELAATLKQKCGTGGTVKDGRIEIQGDQRDRLTEVLESLGYRVKRVGG